MLNISCFLDLYPEFSTKIDSWTVSFLFHCNAVRKLEVRRCRHKEIGQVQHVPWSPLWSRTSWWPRNTLGHLVVLQSLECFVSIEALGKILAAKLYTHFSLKGSKNVKKNVDTMKLLKQNFLKLFSPKKYILIYNSIYYKIHSLLNRRFCFLSPHPAITALRLL